MPRVHLPHPRREGGAHETASDPRGEGASVDSAPATREAPGVPTAQQRYERAARLESSRPADAIAIYRALATESGPWAANALFAAGRLQADRGDRAEAERLLGEYLTRFPHGPNAGDALDLLRRAR
jgi:hypothetical protein